MTQQCRIINEFDEEIHQENVKRTYDSIKHFIQCRLNSNDTEKRIMYNNTKNEPSLLGLFINKYDLSFDEFDCFVDLVIDKEAGAISICKDDIFIKYNLDFKTSRLHEQDLVIEILDHNTNPQIYRYVVSYKARAELSGKEYTDKLKNLDSTYKNSIYDSNSEKLFRIESSNVSENDLILNDATMKKVKLVIFQAKNKDKLKKHFVESGLLKYGYGTTISLDGPPGTGKTLAARYISSNLGKPLLTVKFSQLKSKWVSETEKNISAVFKYAKEKDAILFFDEADAIAFQREFANAPWEICAVNVLLTELEWFEGICLFASNNTGLYDKALESRLMMKIDFSLPNEEEKVKIMKRLLPIDLIDNSVEIDELNLNLIKSGRDVKNVILNAFGIAVSEGCEKIKMQHLKEAIEQTYKTERQNYIG